MGFFSNFRKPPQGDSPEPNSNPSPRAPGSAPDAISPDALASLLQQKTDHVFPNIPKVHFSESGISELSVLLSQVTQNADNHPSGVQVLHAIYCMVSTSYEVHLLRLKAAVQALEKAAKRHRQSVPPEALCEIHIMAQVTTSLGMTKRFVAESLNALSHIYTRQGQELHDAPSAEFLKSLGADDDEFKAWRKRAEEIIANNDHFHVKNSEDE